MSFIQKMTNYNDPASFGSRMRARRSERLRSMIVDIFTRNGGVSIIDMGGEVQYWESISEAFLLAHNVHLTLVNRYDAEKLPSNPNSALYTFVGANCCDLPQYGDRQFDLAHSNSTIEHVGDYRAMCAFAAEARRVGKAQYHQTPNFMFPIEPHFGMLGFHWTPEPFRIWLAMHRQLGNYPLATSRESACDFVQDVRLLTRPAFARLFPGAQIAEEKFCGLTKSFTAIDRGGLTFSDG